MIKKHNIKKIIIISLLLITVITFNCSKAMAGTVDLNPKGDGPVPTPQTPKPNTPGGSLSDTPTYGSSACDVVNCSVNLSWDMHIEINADIKKQDGTSVTGDIFGGHLETEFLAGTYLRLNVYEKQRFTSTASYSVSAKRQVWTCKYYEVAWSKVCIKANASGICIQQGWQSYYYLSSIAEEDCMCSGSAAKVEPEWKGWKDVTSEYIDSCSSQAVPETYELSPLYKASYYDSNDIDAEDGAGTSITIEGTSCNSGTYTSVPATEIEDGYSGKNIYTNDCSFNYNRMSTVCINVKTGKVRYLDNDATGKCDESTEYTITPDEDGYWKYFIPLDANSANDFTFTLKPRNLDASSRMMEAACIDAIEKYPDTYQYIITDNMGNSFINQNLSPRVAKEKVSGGCYFQTTAIIPIEQKFYNEVNSGQNFNGFNFYYKPIDINNPFPNGLNNTSLWYEWNESITKEPDLTQSYDEITYVANTSGNENTIRNYNKDNEYTAWDNMYINGVSGFIEKEGIVTRKNGVENSFYALGCGPNNSNLDVSNAFYQKECNE